jgi:hypothetical protein
MNYALPNVDLKSATPTRTSTLLRNFAAAVDQERVTVGEIVVALGDRGLGVLMAVFAIPNMLPSAVPFGNTVFGLFPLIFAVHLACGFDRLMLPASISNRSISATSFKALVPSVAAVLAWFERLLKPRLPGVTGLNIERVVGVICVVLALITMVPIPFAHNLPALALVLIGLGLIERDGLAIVIGAVIGVAGTVLYGLVLVGLASGLRFLIHGGL